MSSTHEVLRYGANEVRGYVGDVLTLRISPSEVVLPSSGTTPSVFGSSIELINGADTATLSVDANGLKITSDAMVCTGDGEFAGGLYVGGGTAISDFLEVSAPAVTSSGAAVVPGVILQLQKINDFVKIHFPEFTGTAGTPGAALTLTTAVPSAYRPAADEHCFVYVTDATTAKLGTAVIHSSGTVTISVGIDTVFGNSGNNGMRSCTALYHL